MYTTNDNGKHLMTANNMFFNNMIIAYVIKTSKDLKSGSVGVYIPSIMPLIDPTKNKEEKVVSIDKILSKNENIKDIFEKYSEYISYIHAIPLVLQNQLPPEFIKYQQVFVTFQAQDITNCYILPFFTSQQATKIKKNIHATVIPDMKEEDKEMNNANTYRFIMDSTDEKSIILITSKGDGEKYSYRIHIDAQNNNIKISDNSREISLYSNSDSLFFKNRAGSFINIKKDKIQLYARELMLTSDKLNINANNEVNISSNNLNFKANNLISLKSENKIEILTYYLQKEVDRCKNIIKNYQMKSDNFKINVKEALFNGKIKSKGVYVGNNADTTIYSNDLGGDANGFNFGGINSQPLVKSNPLFTVLSEMASKIDTLSTALGVPPSVLVSLNLQITNMISQTIRG